MNIEEVIKRINFDETFSNIYLIPYKEINRQKTTHGKVCKFMEWFFNYLGLFEYTDTKVKVGNRKGVVDLAIRLNGKRIGIEIEDGNQNVKWSVEKLKTFDAGIVVALNKKVWEKYLNYLVGRNVLEKILAHSRKVNTFPSRFKITLLPLFLR